MGKKSDRDKSVQITARLSEDLRTRAHMTARVLKMPVEDWIADLIDRYALRLPEEKS